MIDTNKIRKDFPVLERKTKNNSQIVYLDSAASALTPYSVIESQNWYYRNLSCNIHRGAYDLSQEASDLFEQARKKIEKFLQIPENSNIVFTQGTTDSLNHLAFGWGDENLQEGDEIVLSDLEHHASFVPWNEIAQRKGCKIQYIPINEDLSLNIENINSIINEKTKVVSLIAESNVTGYITPFQKISKRAREVDSFIFLDGAQYASHHPINLKEIDCDALVFSGHKICGPTGIGILWAKNTILENMRPLRFGGDMIAKVTKKKISYASPPQKFEGGTPNISGAVSLKTAIEYVENIGLENSFIHEQNLLKKALKLSKEIDDIQIYGSQNIQNRGGIFSFNIKDVHPHDVATILNEDGIAIRAGSHCAQPLMRQLGISGTVRASFYFYNTIKEVESLFQSLEKVKRFFK